MKDQAGRPRSVYFPYDLFDEIKRRANREDQSFSMIIIRLLRERLQQEKQDSASKDANSQEENKHGN